MLLRYFLCPTLFLIAACPQPTEIPSIASIDGLGGGALTSGLTVQSVDTEAITAKTMSLEQLSVTDIDADSGLFSNRVEAATMTAEVFSLRGWTLGAPLGTALYTGVDDGRPGYRAVDEVCRSAFGNTAHVCSADEAMTAFRAGVDLESEFHEAAVVTYGSYSGLLVFNTGDSADTYVNIDDCEGWTTIETLASGRTISRGGIQNSYPVSSTYLALSFSDTFDTWSLVPPLKQENCSRVKVACCG